MRTTFPVLMAAALLLAAAGSLLAADGAPSIGRCLGFPDDAKLLIVHADDLGMNHSTNRAFADVHAAGGVSSGSILVPAPWFPEIAAYAREHPDVDLGLHLALTSEWKYLRWGSILPASEVPSLLDAQGFLPATAEPVLAKARVDEVEAELRAQVERALAFGIRPSHFDSHMGVLFQSPELLEVYLRLGRDYGVPVLLYPELGDEPWFDELSPRPVDLRLARVVTAMPEVPVDGWNRFYEDAIAEMGPGVTEIVIHLAYDDAETRAVTVGHEAWGSAWRQRDVDFFTSRRFRKLLERHGVTLVTWRQVAAPCPSAAP